MKSDLKISQNIDTSHEYYLTGIIPGLKNSNISGININSPDVNIDGNIKKSNINNAINKSKDKKKIIITLITPYT